MLRQVAAPAGLVIAGVLVLLITGSSTAGTAIAVMLIGTACVVAVSLVFLAVGRSEDSDRANAERPPSPPDPHAGEAARRARPKPPRRPT